MLCPGLLDGGMAYAGISGSPLAHRKRYTRKLGTCIGLLKERVLNSGNGVKKAQTGYHRKRRRPINTAILDTYASLVEMRYGTSLQSRQAEHF